MVHKPLAVIGLLAACAIFPDPHAAEAQTTHEQWGESGEWRILIDPLVDNGCYIERTMDDGTLVQVGYVPNRNGGFFAAYNAAWTGIEDGSSGTVQFDFERSLFGGEYVGVTRDGLPGGYAYFNNPEFIKEFGKRDGVSITGDKGNALEFKLTGTMKAINAMRNCDAEQSR